MRRIAAVLACLCGWSLISHPVASLHQGASGGKIAEGSYILWLTRKSPVAATSSKWSITRDGDVFRIDSGVPQNSAELAMREILRRTYSHMSPEMRDDFSASWTDTDLRLDVAADRQVTNLQLRGVMWRDLRSASIADCVVSEKGISCKTQKNTIRMKSTDDAMLVYLAQCPMAYAPLLQHWKPVSGTTVSVKLLILDKDKQTLRLTKTAATLANLGRESLDLGDRMIDTQKYRLAFDVDQKPRTITLWASTQGVIFAMKDSEMPEAAQIRMEEFQKYADF